MSYLIALYVFYHGNNLQIFGFIPGEKEERPRNQGLYDRSESELSKLLPDDVAHAIVEEKNKATMLDYEAILRNAIEESQAETAKLVNSNFVNIKVDGITGDEQYNVYEDETTDYDMSFFDQMNGLGRSDNYNGGFPW